MTHKQIYTKYMIEYDKANITSSYPSLTKYEVATILDKAYHALIAQKVTGNNVRRAPFEVDMKSVSDIEPLIYHGNPKFDGQLPEIGALNAARFPLPSDFSYFVQAYLNYTMVTGTNSNNWLEEKNVYYGSDTEDFKTLDENEYVNANELYNDSDAEDFIKESKVYGDPDTATESTESVESDEYTNSKNPYDKKFSRPIPVKLVSHTIAERFFTSTFNMPWIKNPVCYLESNCGYVIYDPLNKPRVDKNDTLHLVYIKKPKSFVDNMKNGDFGDVNFELMDHIAEELISLAVAMSLENVESTRLNSKLNMRGLEA